MSQEIAISIKDVSKLYKLYDKPLDRLKESLGLSKEKRYKEHYALRGVSFDVKRGECVGIIGTNGAGKSTILKIITGVLNPTAGEVQIDGRISALLELGAGFNMEYTGIENVYLNGTMIGFSREEIDAKLDEILDFADIGDFVHQPVKTYSSGMFVRLAFAVAINIDPEILIVDEALSVGDVFFQLKCFKKFEEFKQQGKTILFVSHDLSSIERYCDKAILMDHGRNIAEGTPIEIINKYKKIMTGMSVEEMEKHDAGRSANLNNVKNTSGEFNGNGARSGGSDVTGSGTAGSDMSRTDASGSNAAGRDTSGAGASGNYGAGSDVTGLGASESDATGRNENGNGRGNQTGYNSSDTQGSQTGEADSGSDTEKSSSKDMRWQDMLEVNPNLDEYGDMKAKLIDFGVFDDEGNVTTTLIKGGTFTIKSKVEFYEDVEDPIFTFTFKTIKGQDITGTNTMFEKVSVGTAHKGEIYVASFTQEMNLQGGEYLLSMSCTSFVNGDLVAHDRKYDVLNISVVSEKNTVGYYDMNSKVEIERVK